MTAAAAINPPPYRYTERAPPVQLSPWILSFWSFQADATPEPSAPYVVWPDGCTSIALLRRPALDTLLICVGPRITSMHPPVMAGQRLWGFRLWPDAVHAVTGLQAHALRQHNGPAPADIEAQFNSLDAALPISDDPDIVFPIFSQFVEQRLTGVTTPEPRIRAAVRAIVVAQGEVAMEKVAREAGIGLRQLQRLFPAATGLTLREFARVRRLREALAHRLASESWGWSRIAAEVGFVDHAHLTREFVALTGIAPSGAAVQLGDTAHRDVNP